MFRHKICEKCSGCGKEIDDVKTGEDVKTYRKSMNIGLRQLARRIGWSATYVSDLEKGKRHWSKETMVKYMQALDPAKDLDYCKNEHS